MISSRTAPVIVFDVNETLLDITVLEPLFAKVFSDASVMREWFAQLILYSEAICLSGRYVPFGQIAAGVLAMVGQTRGVAVGSADVDELRATLASMPAHPDAAPALATLKNAGFRLVTLTNSPPADSPTPLERAGLADFLDASYSVDTVRRYKPAPETYRMVAEAEGAETADLCMVACHVWDTIGAQAAGCLSALVTRPGNAVLEVGEIPVPDIVGPDLKVVAHEIVDPWSVL